MAPVETSHKLGTARIEANAQRISRFEFPLYEQLINVRTKRYQLILDMLAELRRGARELKGAEVCAWRRLLAPAEPCGWYSPSVSYPGILRESPLRIGQ